MTTNTRFVTRPSPRVAPRRDGLLGALGVAWVAYAVFRIIQTVLLGELTPPGPLNVTRRVLFSMLDGGLMIAMSPFAVWAARRFPVTRRTLVNLPVHFVIGAALSAVGMAPLRWFGTAITAVQFAPWPVYYLNWITGNLFAYTVVVAVAHAFDAQRRARDEQVRVARLEAQLSTARLEALRTQLHPHFLFNTLHAISELVHTNPKAADAMLERLGQLLRRALESSATSDVDVDAEIDYAAAFLDIHKIRHGDQLSVSYDVAPAVRHARVPSLVLQPLVENAIVHGIENSPTGGTVSISAAGANGQLTIVVSDDGPGMDGPILEGLGIGNTRRRLRELFGDAQSLTITPRLPRGVEATLVMPLR